MGRNQLRLIDGEPGGTAGPARSAQPLAAGGVEQVEPITLETDAGPRPARWVQEL
ncbi:MAG: hypothetical protein L0Z62_50225 [Gemmataceae bacterium]|nr:hypothetical protein [Gemmataceae bacterium]